MHTRSPQVAPGPAGLHMNQSAAGCSRFWQVVAHGPELHTGRPAYSCCVLQVLAAGGLLSEISAARWPPWLTAAVRCRFWRPAAWARIRCWSCWRPCCSRPSPRAGCRSARVPRARVRPAPEQLPDDHLSASTWVQLCDKCTRAAVWQAPECSCATSSPVQRAGVRRAPEQRSDEHVSAAHKRVLGRE